MKDSGDQVSSLRKSTKKRAHADARPFGNLASGSIHPGRGEQLSRRRNESVNASLSVGAQAAFAAHVRRRVGALVI